MAEGNLSRLNYGHAGTATFNVDTRTWSFTRHSNGKTFKQIKFENQSTVESIPGSIHFPPAAASTRLTDADHHAKALIRTHAQLAPAIELLPELAVSSAAIVSSSDTYDPLIGNLYSTGRIGQREGTRKTSHWSQRVAASVTGENVNILRLSLRRRGKMGWEDDKSAYIKADSLRDARTGYWNEEAAPIQQVCFAQSEDRSTLLAVRLHTRTVILRPFYVHEPRPARPSPYYHLPSGHIDAHPVLSLSPDQSGGSPHVDVAFNPDYQLQFAVVDQSQIWTVWDIDHGARGDSYDRYSLSRLVQGTISPPDGERTEGEDGWARIIWIGDVNTLAVCSRRQLSILGIQQGASPSYLPCPDLIPKRSSDWILSVQPHPFRRSLFFVLSSTELFLMAVTTASEAIDANAGPSGARILLSWRHYRGSEDLTLTMSVQETAENETCVILHSRLNTVVQIYTFTIGSSQSDSLVCSASPTVLDLMIDAPGHMLQIVVEPCEFRVNESSYSQSLGQRYHSRGFEFYRLFLLNSNLGVHEAVLHSTALLDGGVQQDEAIRDLCWSKVYRNHTQTSRYVQEMDDFLEPEGIEPMEFPELKHSAQKPAFPDVKDIAFAQRTIDHRPLYDAVVNGQRVLDLDRGSMDVPTLIERIKQTLDYPDDLSHSGTQTLLELAGANIAVSDIDEASSALQELLLDIEQAGTVGGTRIARIAPQRSLHVGADLQPDISGLYDEILQSWIASLSQNVPVRLRQHSERLARRIAAEVTLAGMRQIPHGLQAVDLNTQPDVDKRVDMNMPILSSQPLASSPPRMPSTQPLPTPPLSQSGSQPPSSRSPGSLAVHSLEPNSSSQSPTDSEPITRLSRHLRFKDDVLSPVSVPDSVQQLLGQWQPGTDPHTYDWTAAEVADRIENLDEISQQQLEKARKKKERREKRQRREDELARSQPSSQPFATVPIVYPRSSPGPMFGGMGGSSQIPLQPFSLPSRNVNTQGQESSQPFVAQSQVEPGKFGGRPDKKKKKKGGRISGF